jgi:hypothetical protein
VGEAEKRKKEIVMVWEAQKLKKKFSWWGKHKNEKSNSHGGGSTKRKKAIFMMGEAQKRKK